MTSMRMLILSYTIQSVIPNVCTKFQVVLEKSVTKNFIREKEKWTNEGNHEHENAESLPQYK